jgi:hypothetical protein
MEGAEALRVKKLVQLTRGKGELVVLDLKLGFTDGVWG